MTQISDKYAALGGSKSVLGPPAGAERATADGIGRLRDYKSGSIYWSPATGAHEVHGSIWRLWTKLRREEGLLGYPTTDEHATPHKKARVSKFQRGAIYWDSVRGAYEVLDPPPPVTGDPGDVGRWETPPFDSGIVGIHTTLLDTGKLLFFAYRDPGSHSPAAPQSHGESRELDLATLALARPTPAPGQMNLFCAGHTVLPDGRMLVAGGELRKPGLKALHTVEPGHPSVWRHVTNLAAGRWYPTLVVLPDGRAIIIGGRSNAGSGNDTINATYELFDPATNALTAPVDLPFLRQVGTYVTYPFAFVLPSQRLFLHAGTTTAFLDLSDANNIALLPERLEAAARPERAARTYEVQGTAVLLTLDPADSHRARIMLIGGGGAPPAKIRTPATTSCEILNTDNHGAGWQLTAPMALPRVMPDATLLPDGTILVCNGSSSGFADNAANPVYGAEIYDPRTNTWTTMASMTVPRLYHSTAILLPDGRVMTAGSDAMWNPDPFHVAQVTLEIFSPPYLFRGERPRIDDAPASVRFGEPFHIAVSGEVAEVALLRPGSVTHSYNPAQRRVLLRFAHTEQGLRAEAPPNAFVAPPGYYLLFVLDDRGVPSIARFVQVS